MACTNFKGKVVLITGASSGIGAQTAIEFSKHGATLALVGRNQSNLSATAKNCQQTADQPKPLEIIADLSIEKDVKRIMDETIKSFGKLDILVNNAGIASPASIETTTLEQFDTIMNTNLRAVYYLTMLATPHLIKSKGNIVNVSSLLGIRAAPGYLPYCVSKAGLDHFTRCVSLDLAPKGVRVNSINPGVIETDFQRRGGMKQEDYGKFLERCKLVHPLGRHGSSQEVADAILFVATDKASFITGETICVDGGRHLAFPL